ncbi:MAG: polysaccharide pyruvyl transferase family protein [Ruminococcaceae bacterium]|nr:polysaccharide pyruvyl transferase family protein [Oscillospiraceae bacterium]
MKIAIITLNGIKNLGNRLQNYAVQEILKERGHSVSSLLWCSAEENATLLEKAKITLANILYVSNILTSKLYLKHIKRNRRMLLCKEFNDKYINLNHKYFFKTTTMQNHVSDFDYYCVGSDQIWNPFIVQNRDYFFMQFAPSDKTFSFSASMGTIQIPSQYENTYKKGFEHIGKISVREADMQEFIFNLSGRESTLLLDPTLFLSREKWLAVSRPPHTVLPRKYVATYFLNEPTNSQRIHIEQYAKDNQLEVVDISGNYSDYVGPSEFIHIIANADFIFTDSFHGTAFSLIFEKRFLVFQRNNMYNMSSRIVTVLDTFSLPRRFYNVDNANIDKSIYEHIKTIKNEDQSHIPSVLMIEKEKMNRFLDEVLGDD